MTTRKRRLTQEQVDLKAGGRSRSHRRSQVSKRQKPSLHLVKPTLQQLVALSRALTGREPTSEELEKAKLLLQDLPQPPKP